jgi:glyoxylase-like metal-dependent hydrolase (beta-lactamase superfamily II)
MENHNRFKSPQDPEVGRFLKSLGIHPLPTRLPYPAPSQVNAYLIEGDGLLLIDTALNDDESWATLEKDFARLGHTFAEVRRIYLTHGHLDHYGVARRIQDLSGAKVFIHPRDRAKVLAPTPEKQKAEKALYQNYLTGAGFPEEEAANILQFSEAIRHHALPLEKLELIDDGEIVKWGQVALKVMNFPGHTRGMINFYEPIHRILFSGDHILPDISPNPLPDLDGALDPPVPELKPGGNGSDPFPRFQSLIQYLVSIQRVLALDLDLVLPGHGEPIVDHRQLLLDLARFYQERQSRILSILGGKELTPLELSRELFPGVKAFEVILAISEVVGNAEVLEEQGRLVREIRDGKIRYRKK